MLNGEPRYSAAGERSEAARKALAKHDLALVTGEVLYGDWSERWGRQGVKALLNSGITFDGIFCGSDQIARGVVDECTEVPPLELRGRMAVVILRQHHRRHVRGRDRGAREARNGCEQRDQPSHRGNATRSPICSGAGG